MALRKYHGSCHCGKIKFTVEMDLSTGSGKCNCTFCTKNRYWAKMVKPEAFTLISGADFLQDYSRGQALNISRGDRPEPSSAHQLFCRECGVRPFGIGHIPELGGEYRSVNLACLDDLDFREAMEAPIQFFNGRDNNWFSQPEFTAHL